MRAYLCSKSGPRSSWPSPAPPSAARGPDAVTVTDVLGQREDAFVVDIAGSKHGLPIVLRSAPRPWIVKRLRLVDAVGPGLPGMSAKRRSIIGLMSARGWTRGRVHGQDRVRIEWRSG